MREVWFAVPGDISALTGGYIYDRRLIQHLPAEGWRPRLVTLPGSFPRPSPADLAATRVALAAIPRDSVVLVDGLAFGALPTALFEGLGLRIVALVHHPLALESGLDAAEAAAFRAAERAALAAARQVVVTGPATARTLATDYGVASERIKIAQPGTATAPRAAGSAGAPHILTVATLTPRKAHDVLVDALSRIADVPWTAAFVGSETRDPVAAARVKGLIAEHGLAARVAVRGELAGSELDREYGRASVFALPSRHEGYGMAFAEALARGLPIIACAAGAVPDTVPPDTGILAPPDDVDALAEALRRVVTDQGLRRRMSDAAWAHGRTLPDWPDTAQRVAAALEAAA